MKYSGYQHGHPCWVELCTLDWAAAKAFYSQLFGWGSFDMPMPEGAYTMWQVEQDDIGAMYEMDPERKAMGIPAHWTLYMAVDDVHQSVSQAKQLGMDVLHGPHDVGQAGKMAMFRDAEGATFAIWQGLGHKGAKRQGEANTFCWGELACRHPEQAKHAYSSLFNWTTQTKQFEAMTYTEWQANGQSIAGMMQMDEQWGDMPAHWMIYFAVDDCDATAHKTTELGGKICVPPTEIPEVGRFAVLTDPQGAYFSVITLLDPM